MASGRRILFMVLAVAFTAASLALLFGGIRALDQWFGGLTAAQQYWLPKAMMAVSGLLAALAGFNACRRHGHPQDPT